MNNGLLDSIVNAHFTPPEQLHTAYSQSDTRVSATVRLQFHKDFTLNDAVPLVSYFSQMGISHIYASPLMAARPGSRHCYDVVNPGRINPELGGEAALQRLVCELKQHKMGLILDIVSNHMAVGGNGNPWWLDVLEWGNKSQYSRFFDIEWRSPDPFKDGQLLVPFLRTDYGEVLANGEITLHYDQDKGGFYAAHYDHHFPIYPLVYDAILCASDDARLQQLGDQFAQLRNNGERRRLVCTLHENLRKLAASNSGVTAINNCLSAFDVEASGGKERLHQLLEQQHYRLACWRTAADDINWRRFFDVNELGGLRVEDPVVFEATHRKIFEMIAAGWIDGLRIDHVDGLSNPRSYCRKLRRRVDRILSDGRQFPIYVEKIIAELENIPEGWGVTGTTGYEFSNQVSLLQHDPSGQSILTALWEEISQRPASFKTEVYEAKKLLLAGALAGDLENVVQGLLTIAREQPETRDITSGSIRRALTELIAHFPVYRTYVSACGRSATDEMFFRTAVKGAGKTLSPADWPTLERIDQWLGEEALYQLPPGQSRNLRRQIIARFQQLTSPAAAKSVEDTAFYRAGVLLSRYDVGFDAQNFSSSIEMFHYKCLQLARDFPHSLLTTATHDTKRGEDMRARLAVLSERASWFEQNVRQWRTLSARFLHQMPQGPAPTPGDELILYQTLLGSWPLTLDGQSEPDLHTYLERLLVWQRKALREAKLQTSWDAVNESYESACADFLTRLLMSADAAALRSSIMKAAMSIATPGALNSLSQCLLRMTCPGVPDLYQGRELWDFSLVDPDNRRPVDFGFCAKNLSRSQSISSLLTDWREGYIKQWLIAKALNARKENHQLFSQGEYIELAVTGKHAGNVVAFARCKGNSCAVIVVPVRSATLLAGEDKPLVPAHHWDDTRIEIPEFLDAHFMVSILGNQVFDTSSSTIRLADLLSDFPVNFLLSQQKPRGNNHEKHY